MPESMRLRILTSDGAGLCILGFLAVARGLAHTPLGSDPLRTPTHLLATMLPAEGWGVLWILLGVLCIVAIWVRKLRPMSIGLMVSVHFLWAISLLSDDYYPNSVDGLSYLCIAGLTIWSFARGRLEPVLFHEDLEV